MGQCVGVWDVCQVGGGSTMTYFSPIPFPPEWWEEREELWYMDDIIGFPDGTIWHGFRLWYSPTVDGFQVFYKMTALGLQQTSTWEHYKNFTQFVGVGEKTIIDQITEEI